MCRAVVLASQSGEGEGARQCKAAGGHIPQSGIPLLLVLDQAPQSGVTRRKRQRSGNATKYSLVFD